jgi:hypothetical protein
MLHRLVCLNWAPAGSPTYARPFWRDLFLVDTRNEGGLPLSLYYRTETIAQGNLWLLEMDVLYIYIAKIILL